VLIVDDTLVPTRDHGIAERSKNYRYSTNHQVGIGADTRLFVAGWPVAGNRNDCKAWELSGAKDALSTATVIADGSYRGTGLVVPHPRERGQGERPLRKEEHNAPNARSAPAWSHPFARRKGWRILRDAA
jgi:hypothetical protein